MATASEGAATPKLTLDGTLGALEVGILVAMFLFGLETVQTFHYYKKFPNDSLRLKLFVAWVWTLELAHTILSSHSIYWLSVTRYGHPEALLHFPITTSIACVLTGLIGPAIQAFFAYRVLVLSNSYIIPVICWVLSFARGVSLFGVAAVTITHSILEFRERLYWLPVLVTSISAALDMIIAASLTYQLWKRREADFKGTQRLIDQVIKYTIQTGLITSIAALALLILFVTKNDNFAWLGLFYVISRLFANSLMASLNARAGLRRVALERGETNIEASAHIPTFMPSTRIEIEMSTHYESSSGSESSPRMEEIKSYKTEKAGRKLFSKHLEQYRPEDPLYETYQDERGNTKRRKRAIPPGLSKRDADILRSVQKRAHYLDKSFSLCGFQFGWSFWIGLIPVAGDAIVAGMNYGLVIRKARQAEIPPWLLAQMMTHLGIGAGVGLVPLVGDLVVAIYKPNSRNAALLYELLRVRGEQLLALENKETAEGTSTGTKSKKGSLWRGKKSTTPPVTEHDAEQIKPGAGMTSSGMASPEYVSSSDEKTSPKRLAIGSSSKKAV